MSDTGGRPRKAGPEDLLPTSPTSRAIRVHGKAEGPREAGRRGSSYSLSRLLRKSASAGVPLASSMAFS